MPISYNLKLIHAWGVFAFDFSFNSGQIWTRFLSTVPEVGIVYVINEALLKEFYSKMLLKFPVKTYRRHLKIHAMDFVFRTIFQTYVSTRNQISFVLLCCDDLHCFSKKLIFLCFLFLTTPGSISFGIKFRLH